MDLKREGGHEPRNIEAEEDKGTDSPLGPPERSTQCPHLDFSPVRPVPDF